jgi:hypothetical protein
MKYLKVSLLFYFILLFPYDSYGSSKNKSAIQLSIASGNLLVQSETIRREIAGSAYIEMSSNNRIVLNKLLDDIVDNTVDSSEKTKAERDINLILSNAFDDSILICRNESVMGTNRKQQICMTKAQKTGRYKDVQLDLQRDLIPKSTPLEIQ